ncbi:MAG: hypothetical protein QM764_06985 [Chitinophagaceae bacterium]
MIQSFTLPATVMTNKILLKQLADNLIKDVLPEAVNRKSLIINDIPQNVYLSADTATVTHILGSLLNNTVNSSHNGCIRVAASQEDGYTVLSVQDNNNDYSRFISGKMEKVKPAVKKAGGDLSFEFNKRNSITILVSFSKASIAA